MGLDLWCLPVRLESAPVRLIRCDARAWQAASEHPPFTTAPPGIAPPEVNRALLAELPGARSGTLPGRLDRRIFPFPDRSCGQAEYLLDPAGYPTRKSWAERERSFAYRVVEGDELFAPHAAGIQGVPWRCSDVEFLAAAAAAIEAISPAAARAQFSVATLTELGVYKAPGAGADEDEVFARVLDRLRGLARYYRRVAAAGLGLILAKD